MPEKERGAVANGKAGAGGQIFYGDNTIIGDSGEYFCGSLFGLLRHRDGDRRPDLISVNGDYTPRFSLEVKTSQDGRGVVHPYALSYGFTSSYDYASKLGGLPPQYASPSQLLLDGVDTSKFRGIEDAALYYSIMYREDDLSLQELSGQFKGLRLQLGDQILVPHELVFYDYVIGRMMRNPGSTFDDAFNSVRDTVFRFITGEYGMNHKANEDRHSIHFRDYYSIFLKDESVLASPKALERVSLLKEHYPGEKGVFGLDQTQYEGPSGSHIYVLYKPEHEDLFLEQVKSRVIKRRNVLTQIAHQRQREADRLDMGYRIGENGPIHKGPALPSPELPYQEPRVLHQKDMTHLENLLRWRRDDDVGPEFTDFHPTAYETLQPENNGHIDGSLF